MRTKVPNQFSMSFIGKEGQYTVHFKPIDDWTGVIDVRIGGRSMEWFVYRADKMDDGSLVLGGMTSETDHIWSDNYWFELHKNCEPSFIRYWGDRVVWREDFSL